MNRIRPLLGLVAALAVLFGTASAVNAGSMLNTVGDTAEITADRHGLDATVVIGCTEGERLRFQLTVTQGDTVGVARGAGRCAGDPDGQVYEVTVVGTHGGTFEPGPAEAEAWAETRHGQHTHPRHTWTKSITLAQ